MKTNKKRSRISAVLEGMASVGDLFAVRTDPEVEAIMRQSDAEALAGDWRAVAGDFRDAMEQTRKRLGVPS